MDTVWGVDAVWGVDLGIPPTSAALVSPPSQAPGPPG